MADPTTVKAADINKNDMQEEAGSFTSQLFHPAVIVFWLAASFLTAVYEKHELSLFFAFVFLLSCASFCWAKFSLVQVKGKISFSTSGLFPGQKLTVRAEVHNGKILPLIWLELLLPWGEAGNFHVDGNRITEDRDARLYEKAGTELIEIKKYVCVYGFSLLKWHQTLRCRDQWTAQRRGVYELAQFALRSGDGFGFSALKAEAAVEQPERVFVYPRLVPVKVDKILNEMWESRSAAYGYLEDVSRIRTVRDYMPGDAARRVNHRLLARGAGLKVNQYEIVTPDSVFFIFDGASFQGMVNGPDAFEEALSVVASLIEGLEKRGVRTGLLASASRYYPETCVFSSGDEADFLRMMKLLSAVAPENPPFSPAACELHFQEHTGQTFYAAYSEKAARSVDLLDFLPEQKTRLLVTETGPAGTGSRLKAETYSSYRRYDIQ